GARPDDRIDDVGHAVDIRGVAAEIMAFIKICTSSQVDHKVRSKAAEGLLERPAVEDIELAPLRCMSRLSRRSGVQVEDLRTGAEERLHGVRSDEPGATGD